MSLHKQAYTLMVLLITIGFLCPNNVGRSQAQGSGIERIAYLNTSLDNASLQVKFVDANTAMVAEQRDLPIPDGIVTVKDKVPFAFSPNPKGDWVALYYVSEDIQGYLIRLYNLHSGQILDVYRTSSQLFTQNAMWSPDGRYLTIEERSVTEANLLFISLQGNYTQNIYSFPLTQFTYTNSVPFSFGWSQDSTLLAVSIAACRSLEPIDCPTILLTYSIPSLSLVSSVNQFPWRPNTGIDICQPSWSSNNRYLAFFSGCNSSSNLMSSEAYLFDTATNQVTKLTNFLSDFVNDPARTLFDTAWARYDLAWLNSDSLLIGVTYTKFLESTNPIPAPISQLLLYNTMTGVIYPISNTSAATSIQLRPNGTLVGYHEYGNVNPDKFLETNAGVIRLAELQNSNLVTVFTGTNGCETSWSPSGRYFAYTRRIGTKCLGQLQAIAVRDLHTNSSAEYQIPSPTVPTEYFFLAWVVGNNLTPRNFNAVGICSPTPATYHQ